MIELISDRPLLIQIFDWLYFLGKCRDARDFSKNVLGRCPGYLTAYRSMNFKPSAKVLIGVRTAILKMSESECHQPRQTILTELAGKIDETLLGKGDAS